MSSYQALDPVRCKLASAGHNYSGTCLTAFSLLDTEKTRDLRQPGINNRFTILKGNANLSSTNKENGGKNQRNLCLNRTAATGVKRVSNS